MKTRVPTGYIGREPKHKVRAWRERLRKRQQQRQREEELLAGLAAQGDEHARRVVLSKAWKRSQAHRAVKPTKVELNCMKWRDR